jgi:pantoate--beta-alanine ligase
LPHALQEAGAQIEAGARIGPALDQAKNTLLQAGFASVDYVALVDSASLEPLETLDREARMLAAARIGTTRLIDNFPVRSKN